MRAEHWQEGARQAGPDVWTHRDHQRNLARQLEVQAKGREAILQIVQATHQSAPALRVPEIEIAARVLTDYNMPMNNNNFWQTCVSVSHGTSAFWMARHFSKFNTETKS